MGERIYHDQMNDPKDTEQNPHDIFRPQDENGRWMAKDKAIDQLHREALVENGMSEAQITGRERMGAFTEAAGRGVERCKGIWGGIKEKTAKAVGWLKKLGISAKGVGEKILGSDEHVKAAYDGTRERAGKIREGLVQRAEAAIDKCTSAGGRAVEKGSSLWSGAVERVQGVIGRGNERIDGAKMRINDRMNEIFANNMLAEAERHDNIADHEIDKATRLLKSAAVRRESAGALREKARELAPQLFEEEEVGAQQQVA